ncbi:hypothetical protein GSbR_26030 [Geobacter sp. SVR]|nr:hypothetical protein GSVR_35100 [Geobacter sp. SVR]GCF86003.1 hypothetical protein GSbR_26030 [Geobacter sp. SVR]
MATDGYLSFEDGAVRLGKDLLPGILVGISVNAGVRFDRATRDHMSGKNRIPQGWEDADIKLTVDLICDNESDCYTKLAIINTYFKDSDKGANPQIYNVTNRHLRSRGVSRVVFSGLQSDEDDQCDVIRAVLSFSEHLPAVVKREQQANASKAALGAPPPAKAKPVPAPSIVKDDNPLIAGYKAGLK